MGNQLEVIKTEFTKQAAKFNTYMANTDKEQFNRNAIERMRLTGNENVLEVAAGTCAFGRMIAPKVRHITELDATEAMLSVGRTENEKVGIINADYMIGAAEQMPFEDEQFDVVVSRLAFHHFADAETVFAEMYRVLKPNGQLVIADMLAKDQPYRDSADKYETLRDPSHVRCLAMDAFSALVEKYRMSVEHSSVAAIPIRLTDWLALTNVPNETKAQITTAMAEEINGSGKTGFEPYLHSGEIMFDHNWLLLIACKK